MYSLNGWIRWVNGQKSDDDINDIKQLQNQIEYPEYLYKEYYYDKLAKQVRQRRICLQYVNTTMLEKSKKIIEDIICSSIRFYANFNKEEIIIHITPNIDLKVNKSIKCYINLENKLTPESCIIDRNLEKKINEFNHNVYTNIYIAEKKLKLEEIHTDFCITPRYINYLKLKINGNLDDVKNYKSKLDTQKNALEMFIDLIDREENHRYHELIEMRETSKKQTQDQLSLLGL